MDGGKGEERPKAFHFFSSHRISISLYNEVVAVGLS